MSENPYLKKLPKIEHTTGFGVVGESLTAIGVFLPFPFNVGAIGLGLIMKGLAWHFAKDRDAPVPATTAGA